MAKKGKAVQISHSPVAEIKHTMKAAQLLYSAPSFILRGPIYLVVIIVFTAFFYSFWAKKDNLVVCTLALRGDYTTVQSPTGGIIEKVQVFDGNKIDLLTDLVEIQIKTRATMESEEESLEKKKKRLEKEKKWNKKEQQDQKILLDNYKQSLRILLQNKNLLKEKILQDKKQFKSLVKSAGQKIKTVNLQLKQAIREVESLGRQIVVIKESFEEDKALYEKNLITKPEFNNSQMRYESLKKNQADARDRVSQIELTLADTKTEPVRIDRQKERRMIEHNEESLRLSQRITELNHSMKSLTFKSAKDKEMVLDELKSVEESLRDVGNLIPGVTFEGNICKVQSTFAGTVTNVYVKPGQMINPGEPLLNVVKDIEPIYAEILVQNKDIGSLKINQEVKIKYFAYPYQEYGIKAGRISRIATRPSDAPGQESMYRVRVALDNFTIRVGSRNEPLALGLQGNAEIKTGEKRLIELIFSPISKFFIQEE